MSEQQLELFSTATADSDEDRAEDLHERNMKRARSPEVLDDILAVFRAHPDRWIRGMLDCPDLRAVGKKWRLNIEIYWAIAHMERKGLLEMRKVYHGATTPVGNTPAPAGKRKKKTGEIFLLYLGYAVEYRARMEAPA